jgi:N-acetyl-anhydromuramyl-L-alanine amidase AmpD
MRPLKEIIVHCTATQPKWMDGQSTKDKVAEVRRWHMQDRGWKDIGYHYLIDRDGTLMDGRPLEQVGAHTMDHNTGTIGVSLFGGHGASATDKFYSNFTEAQDKALRALITKLCNTYKITKVSGHNEYAAKACPGFNVLNFLGKQQELKK